ncbi:MAG: hypothetical protein ACR2RV_26330, partial [Verrucomicrobiales bacterium]
VGISPCEPQVLPDGTIPVGRGVECASVAADPRPAQFIDEEEDDNRRALRGASRSNTTLGGED